ncbi:MAG: superoxide dismutase family protein [Dehalococcoidia bacterium]|nr:superoxide dismutase family protein [Dehalococcoidia bacterium]
MRTFAPRFLVLAAAALSAVGVASAALADDPAAPAYTGPAVETITSTLRGPDGAALGAVQLSQDAAGVVRVTVDVSQLPAGPHGIHLHSVGTCEGPAFTSAGGHVNPASKQHGLLNPAGPHAGDLPGIDETTVDLLMYNGATSLVTLMSGPRSLFDVDGSALVVHMNADDQMTDPTGNSGARIACAVLAAPNPALATATPKPPATGSGAAGDAFPGWLPLAVGGGLLVLAGAGAATAGRRR